jgi:hypothetical protein
MHELTAWIQSNWYALGNLVSQIAFLGAGVWFARKILKTMRSSQEQVGALLKLSVTGTMPERQAPSVAERSFASASPYWLTPAEIPPAGSPQLLPESGPSRWMVARQGLIVWLRTPMSSGGAAPWRKAVRWLQSPAGS